ncbi:unnamed protein product [Boreogadus saida]
MRWKLASVAQPELLIRIALKGQGEGSRGPAPFLQSPLLQQRRSFSLWVLHTDPFKVRKASDEARPTLRGSPGGGAAAASRRRARVEAPRPHGDGLGGGAADGLGGGAAARPHVRLTQNKR